MDTLSFCVPSISSPKFLGQLGQVTFEMPRGPGPLTANRVLCVLTAEVEVLNSACWTEGFKHGSAMSVLDSGGNKRTCYPNYSRLLALRQERLCKVKVLLGVCFFQSVWWISMLSVVPRTVQVALGHRNDPRRVPCIVMYLCCTEHFSH